MRGSLAVPRKAAQVAALRRRAWWIRPGSRVTTDGRPVYNGLVKLGYLPQRTLQSEKGKKTGDDLPRVHLLDSNLKRWLLRTYKGAVFPHHLPAYLNEFAFRFPRRFWRGPAFHRALGLLTPTENWPEYDTFYSVAKGGEGAWVHPSPPANTRPMSKNRCDKATASPSTSAGSPLRRGFVQPYGQPDRQKKRRCAPLLGALRASCSGGRLPPR